MTLPSLLKLFAQLIYLEITNSVLIAVTIILGSRLVLGIRNFYADPSEDQLSRSTRKLRNTDVVHVDEIVRPCHYSKDGESVDPSWSNANVYYSNNVQYTIS